LKSGEALQVPGHADAICPYEYPAPFSMIVFFFSITGTSARAVHERALYGNQRVDCELGGVQRG
jgi:cation/acetate symporter